METLGLWSETEWWVQLVWNLLIFALPTLVAMVAVNAGGAKVVETARTLFKAVRPAIDEPSDIIVLKVAEITGRRPEVVSAFLVERIDQVVALLPQEAVK